MKTIKSETVFFLALVASIAALSVVLLCLDKYHPYKPKAEMEVETPATNVNVKPDKSADQAVDFIKNGIIWLGI